MTGLNSQTPTSLGRMPDTRLVKIKVEEDIAFLHARISAMEAHPRPNRLVLDTYKSMLNSRLSVLKWLQHGNESEETELPDKRSA